MSLANSDIGNAKVVDSYVVGNHYGTLETGIYPFFLEEAFIENAASGAVGIHLTFKEKKDGTGKVLENTVYIQSGNEKGNKSYYIDKQGVQQPLPGYTLIDSLCKILTGKPLKGMATATMAAEVYDYDEKKRVTTNVQMLKALLGKPIYVAVIKEIKDKTVKNDAGKYVAAGGTREGNEIVKFFRAKDKKTVTEIESNSDKDAAFYHTWAKEWTGKTRNRSSSKNTVAPAGATNSTSVDGMFT